MDFLYEMIVNKVINPFFDAMIEEALSMFMTFLVGVSEIGLTVLDLPVVVNGILLAQTVALSILAVKGAYEALMLHILRVNGDPNDGPESLLKGIIQSAIVISCIPWIVKYIYSFGLSLSKDAAQLPGNVELDTNKTIIEQIIGTIQDAVTMPIFLLIGVIFILILVVVILMQTFYRGAELGFHAVLGCFMALGLTSRTPAWDTWMKDMLSIASAPVAQMFLIKLAFSSLHAITFDNPWYHFMLFVSFLILTASAPAGIKKAAHSTGVGRFMGGAAQTTAQTAVSAVIMRKLMSK